MTVLKDGRLAGSAQVAETSTDELIRADGRARACILRARPRRAGRRRRARGRTTSTRRRWCARHRSPCGPGEIVCLAGLIGAGPQRSSARRSSARGRRRGGSIRIGGKPIDPTGPWDGKHAGIGMVPEDRKAAGLFLAWTSSTTSPPPSFQVSLRRQSLERARPRRWRRISSTSCASRRRASTEVVGNLSGGNQQKVLLAKWLAIGAAPADRRRADARRRRRRAPDIYRLLRALADKGVALLVVSSDLPEVLALAHRIVVMAEGQDGRRVAGRRRDREQVLRLATRYTASVAEVRKEPAMAEA